MASSNSISQKEYLKKYLSGDVKKKKKKKVTGANIKRSVIVDDDIDLKSMRPLEDDEVELYQMDEEAPQIAGIIDERPPEVKAQEYYSSKRWKVFGGENGVNIVDSMNKNQDDNGKTPKTLNNTNDTEKQRGESHVKSMLDKDSHPLQKGKSSHQKDDSDESPARVQKGKSSRHKNDSDESPPRVQKGKSSRHKNDSDESPPRVQKGKSSRHKNDSDESPPRVQKGKSSRHKNDSDESPPRVQKGKSSRHKNDSDESPPRVQKEKSSHYKYDSDESPPRVQKEKSSRPKDDSDVSLPRKRNRHSGSDSDESPPRKDSRKKSPIYSRSSRYEEMGRGRVRNRSYSSSPPRRNKTKKQKYKNDGDNSPPRREKNSYKRGKSDSDDASPPRREKHLIKQEKYDSDASPPRRTGKFPDKKSQSRGLSRDLDKSPPRKDRRKSPKPQFNRKRHSRSRTPDKKYPYHSSISLKDKSPRSSRTGINDRNSKRQSSDSDNSPQRRRGSERSDSDMSPPRKDSRVNDRPMKKKLYKPNDDSSSDEGTKTKDKKMKTTLDGKQAGLQDAKQLKKELMDLKMKEDTMFSKMDASVSGIGAAPVKRDRKTGQIRDLEKEKEAQREKAAKESVVNEKYYKWGKGLKQTEDAAVRAAEVMKEMNKPLARYVDDKDLDEYLKAQDREGDPMLDYIKRKQSESTPLQGEKPLYKGSCNPNRFNIRPGYRWDGVVRSNGYEQEWFKTKNAKKARDEEAYKWSTSDM